VAFPANIIWGPMLHKNHVCSSQMFALSLIVCLWQAFPA
jgi:hypothetical protein